jgi:hypothetical protein
VKDKNTQLVNMTRKNESELIWEAYSNVQEEMFGIGEPKFEEGSAAHALQSAGVIENVKVYGNSDYPERGWRLEGTAGKTPLKFGYVKEFEDGDVPRRLGEYEVEKDGFPAVAGFEPETAPLKVEKVKIDKTTGETLVQAYHGTRATLMSSGQGHEVHLKVISY